MSVVRCQLSVVTTRDSGASHEALRRATDDGPRTTPLLIGRHSAISTVSPSLASLVSSWAWSTVRRFRYLPYFSWRVWYATTTLIVLSPLSEPTMPWMVRSCARSTGFCLVRVDACCFAMFVSPLTQALSVTLAGRFRPVYFE